MSDNDTEMRLEGLDKLVKALKAKPPVIKVGILGKGAARAGGKVTNAYVGYVHEYGKGKNPKRSFLREPLQAYLGPRMIAQGALDQNVLKAVIASGSLIAWCEGIAVLAEGIVLEAFDTCGFGKWQPSNMSRKKVKQTLVETQQLRNSISSKVVA